MAAATTKETDIPDDLKLDAPLCAMSAGPSDPQDETMKMEQACADELSRYVAYNFVPDLLAAQAAAGGTRSGRHVLLRYDMGKFIHAAGFVAQRPHVFPVLRSILPTVPSSCHPESVFSTTKWVLGGYRWGLGASTAEQSVILSRTAKYFDELADERNEAAEAVQQGPMLRRSKSAPARGSSRSAVKATFKEQADDKEMKEMKKKKKNKTKKKKQKMKKKKKKNKGE